MMKRKKERERAERRMHVTITVTVTVTQDLSMGKTDRSMRRYADGGRRMDAD